MGYVEEVLADSPKIFHRLTDNPDSAGSLSISPTVNDVSYVAGKYGKAIKMNSTSGYLLYALPEDIYAGEWTIEAWFKISTTKDYNNILRISATDGSNHVGLRIRGSQHAAQYRPNVIELFTYDDNGVWGDVQVPTTVNANDGNWHYVVVQAKGSGSQKNLRMFFDGTWYTNGSNPYTYPITGLVGQTQKIGAGPDPGGVEAFIDGGIDEVAVYNYALSDARVTAHYTAVESGPPVSVLSGLTNTLALGSLLGPTVALGAVQTPPMAVNAGVAGTLTLAGLSGPTIAKGVVVVAPKAINAGYAGTLYLNELGSTLVLTEPVVWESTGQWFFEVVMAEKSMDARNTTASLEVRNDQKRLRPELKTLVRA